MKHAGIYIRVSSERQAEKASPDAQEEDCRAYCESREYSVVDVYSDTEKYRVGRKMVEPSGSRSDRPQFKRMMRDVDSGKIDTVIAWRMDRISRGATRLELELYERIENKVLTLELVKEYFDVNIAPVLSWQAKRELQAKHDRLMMGVAARLKEGKPWCPTPPYGYYYQDGSLHIDESESIWVNKIYDWRIEGLSFGAIRQRLINNGARQRKANNKTAWGISEIREKLQYKPYHTGIMKIKWDGKVYKIAIPPIVPVGKYEAVQKISARYKSYPSGGMRANALAPGVVYCKKCNRVMAVVTNRQGNHEYIYYACTTRGHTRIAPEGCARYVKMGRIDADIWRKIEAFLFEPGKLEAALLEKIELLQESEEDAQAEVERLARELEAVNFERQKIITWGRKEFITEDDMQIQLFTLQETKNEIVKELGMKRILANNHSGRLIELAELFRAQVMAGWELVIMQPKTEEEAELQFKARKGLIEALVGRVDVFEDKSIKVHLGIDLEDDSCTTKDLLCCWQPPPL